LVYGGAVPITWRIDPSARFAAVSVSDPYTFQEWRTAILELFDAPGFQPHRSVLVDRRAATPATAAFVNQMTEFFEEHRDRLAKRAAIVVGDDTAFGMARMTEIKAELHNIQALIRTFRSYDDAINWLVPR
jgi:hypothetical protein